MPHPPCQREDIQSWTINYAVSRGFYIATLHYVDSFYHERRLNFAKFFLCSYQGNHMAFLL